MHFVGAPKNPSVIAPGECEGGVFNEVRVETKVAGHSNCGFDGIVGDYSGNYQGIYACAPQALF